MKDAAFIAIYGVIFLAGMFMLPAWLNVWLKERRTEDVDAAEVAFGFALNSVGTILIFGARLAFGFESGNWTSVGGWPGAIVMIGLAFFEASKIALMRVRKRHGDVWTWRWWALLSVLWAVGAVAWRLTP